MLDKNIKRNNTLDMDDPIDILNKKGATVDKACEVLADMLSATTFQKDSMGRISDVPDHKVRHLGALTVLEVQKVIKDKGIITNVSVINDPTIMADAERIIKLRKVTSE
jgi:hypothetical protein